MGILFLSLLIVTLAKAELLWFKQKMFLKHTKFLLKSADWKEMSVESSPKILHFKKIIVSTNYNHPVTGQYNVTFSEWQIAFIHNKIDIFTKGF